MNDKKPRRTEDLEHEPHRGPTTPAEEASRQAPGIPAEDKVKIAEEASREEDA